MKVQAIVFQTLQHKQHIFSMYPNEVTRIGPLSGFRIEKEKEEQVEEEKKTLRSVAKTIQ